MKTSFSIVWALFYIIAYILSIIACIVVALPLRFIKRDKRRQIFKSILDLPSELTFKYYPKRFRLNV